MIADISSLGGGSVTAPHKTRGPNFPSLPVAGPTPPVTPDSRQLGRATERHLFALAFRQFNSLLPTIETLSADLQ